MERFQKNIKLDSAEMKEIVMKQFLNFIDGKTNDLILKGDSALRFCYNSSRMSDDLDFDARSKVLGYFVESFCKKYDYEFIQKNKTDYGERYMIHFSESENPLKIESSLREKNIPVDEIEKINNILTYEFNFLVLKKLEAFIDRDKIRDLYDISVVCVDDFPELNKYIKSSIRSALANKGENYFEYITDNQDDDKIDKEVLADKYLRALEKLNVFNEDRTRLEEEKDKPKKKLERDFGDRF